jgi:hypothetical protein
MQHYVKTAYGTSNTSYGSLHIPLQGALQGNGAGSTIRMLISAPLINMLRTQGFGFKSSNLLSDESYHFACYTYVDHTELIHNGNADTTPSAMVADMQRMLDHWAGGLRATGGALVPSKSYSYDIVFKWNRPKSTWEYKTLQELPGSLTLRDHLQLTTLRRMDVHQANETLGLWIAANGNQMAQIRAFRNIIGRWTGKIRTKQLTKVEAWLSLRMGVAKALRYPLTTTCIPKKIVYHIGQTHPQSRPPGARIPADLLFQHSTSTSRSIRSGHSVHLE